MRLALPLASLLLAACASPIEVRAQRAPGFEPSRYRTYAWAESRPSGDPRVRDEEMERILKASVDAELAARGYRLAAESPEMRFDYFLLLDREQNVGTVDRTLDPTGAFVWVSDTSGTEGVYTQGTIVLDVADAKSREPLWRATAASTVEANASPAQRERRIREAVRRMLSRFP